ncbi:hypothetical protein [Nonlabens sp.]
MVVLPSRNERILTFLLYVRSINRLLRVWMMDGCSAFAKAE